jgi:hypothetical protein
MKIIKKKLKRFKENQQGTFTLEASLVFPIIMFTLIIFLLLSIYFYEKITVYYVASSAAEKASFLWDNNGRKIIKEEDIINVGGLEKTDDKFGKSSHPIVSTIEYIRTNRNTNEVSNPEQISIKKFGLGEIYLSNTSSENDKKLKVVSDTIPVGLNGTVKYDKKGNNKVVVEVSKPLKLPDFFLKLIGNKKEVEERAISYTSDPTEFMRNIDLTRVIAKEILDFRK